MTDARTTAMIARATGYFADVDRFDIDATMSHFHSECLMEVVTHGVLRRGPAEIRETYAKRKESMAASWHGNFKFMSDPEAGRLAVRLDVKRKFIDGREMTIDALTLLEFAGDRISRISVWMPGENTLK
jgi:hypothetical protein